MRWGEDHREFKDWVLENYDIEPLQNMIQYTIKANGNINTKMFWNPHRDYPEVGDYVTDVNAGPAKITYVGKVVKRSKGKRPKYDVEILYSYEKHDKPEKENIQGFFLAKLEKKDKWKPFNKKK